MFDFLDSKDLFRTGIWTLMSEPNEKKPTWIEKYLTYNLQNRFWVIKSNRHSGAIVPASAEQGIGRHVTVDAHPGSVKLSSVVKVAVRQPSGDVLT